MLKNPLATLLLGLIVGVLSTIALSVPRVGRGLGKITAVVLLAIGAGLMTWAIFAASRGDEFQTLEFGPILFCSMEQTLGWGVGCVVGGITALVLSFVGSRSTGS